MPQVAEVANALRAAERALNHIGGYLVGKCAVNGQIAVEKLDCLQSAAFDLAFMRAELEAAEALAGSGGSVGSRLNERLTQFFVADMVSDMTNRIGLRFQEFGLTRVVLEASLRDASLVDWAGRVLSPSFYEEIAVLLSKEWPAYGLSPEHEDIRGLFRKFAETRVVPLAEKIHREDLVVPEEVITQLSEMGGFGLSIPQRYEGFQDDMNPDNLGMVLATEELSRGSLGAAGSLVTRPEILAKALIKGGTQEQRTKWLPLIATGKKMVCVAVTEPGFGSDVAGIIVKAIPKGGGWVIHGTKMWCTFAGRSEIIMVLARTDPDASKRHRGLSVLIAEKPPFAGDKFEYRNPEGGVISGRQIPCIGYRGMHTFEVIFDNYWVPEENLIGGPEGLGKGFYFQMEGFAGGRIQTAARANGVGQAALEDAMKYALARKVFGRPIFDYQLTRWKLARMAAHLMASRQLTYKVAGLFDKGQGQMEASLAKLFASRICEWITREAVQIHGAMGYAEETPVSRYFLDAKVFSIFEGAEEILALRVIAKNILEEALITSNHASGQAL